MQPDPRGVTALAPAKINLHLGVGDARADGFHELVTVYQALDLWERVTVAPAPDGAGDSVTVEGPSAAEVPTDRSNLAARAVDLLREEAGDPRPLAVHIVKGIPVAGGMAGGSADCAAALVAANRLLGLGLGRDELERRAALLGSDIPFCVRGGTVLGTGRGEELATLLHPGPELHWVVATADGSLSTPAVYAELDRQRASSERPRLGSTDALLAALTGGSPHAVAAALGNDLQSAAVALRPALRRTLRAGRESGALAGLVSGSGPTCVFLCESADAAVGVATELSGHGVAREVRVARGPVRGAHLVEG